MRCDDVEEFEQPEDRLRALLYSLVLRTPKLKSFDFSEDCASLSATRSLAHLWIRIHAIFPIMITPRAPARKWLRAALSLRPTLWHITSTRHSQDPKLATEDVQAIPEQLRNQRTPTVIHSRVTFVDDFAGEAAASILYSSYSSSSNDPPATNETKEHPLSAYFPWLEDHEVAGRIACTWNMLVDEGKHNDVKCECGAC